MILLSTSGLVDWGLPIDRPAVRYYCLFWRSGYKNCVVGWQTYAGSGAWEWL